MLLAIAILAGCFESQRTGLGAIFLPLGAGLALALREEGAPTSPLSPQGRVPGTLLA